MAVNNVLNTGGIISLGGTLSTAGAHTLSGAFASTFTFTGTTTVTFPTSGTLATTGQVITWSTVTGTSQTLSPANGYFANNASLITFTIPVTTVVGDTYRIEGQGAGGWTVVYNSGQSVIFGNQTSTTTTGSWASTNQFDGCTIVCMVANTTFKITSAVGNLTKL